MCPRTSTSCATVCLCLFLPLSGALFAGLRRKHERRLLPVPRNRSVRAKGRSLRELRHGSEAKKLGGSSGQRLSGLLASMPHGMWREVQDDGDIRKE